MGIGLTENLLSCKLAFFPSSLGSFGLKEGLDDVTAFLVEQ